MFDFAKALAELKKSKSLATTKKKLEVIFQEMHDWENTDNILEKPADIISQIGFFLVNCSGDLHLNFYQRLLSDEFDTLRAKFDHYDLAYLYTYAGACFSRNAMPAAKTNATYKKAEFHLEAIEIDKYGVEAGLRSYGCYHVTRAMYAYRHRDFVTAQFHIRETIAYEKKIISVSRDQAVVVRSEKGLYHMTNIHIAILNQKREFTKVLEHKETLEELIKYVAKEPSAWGHLFFLRGNLGVAELSLGYRLEALQNYQLMRDLCITHQSLALVDSDDLQSALSGQCLILSLLDPLQTMRFKANVVQLQKVFTNTLTHSQKYYAFLLEWSLLIVAIKDNDIANAKTHFTKTKHLAELCQLQDFEMEWGWFCETLQNSNSKHWNGVLLKSPFPMFAGI